MTLLIHLKNKNNLNRNAFLTHKKKYILKEKKKEFN